MKIQKRIQTVRKAYLDLKRNYRKINRSKSVKGVLMFSTVLNLMEFQVLFLLCTIEHLYNNFDFDIHIYGNI